MMVGMMMQAVAVMSVKAHVSRGHFLNTGLIRDEILQCQTDLVGVG